MFRLDHVVITTRGLGQACSAWGRLGFHLTPRGYHPFGTKNNIIVLGSTFLELFSFHDRAAFDAAIEAKTMPADLGALTAEALETRDGPSLLAVRTADVEADFGTLAEGPVAIGQAIDFARPVTLPDGTETKAEITVNYLASENGGGLPLFVSIQHNRDALWVEEWQRHPNGAVDLVEAIFVAERPADYGAYLGAIFGDPVSADDDHLIFSAGDGEAIVMTPERFTERFSAVLGVTALGSPGFEALKISVRDVSLLERLLSDAEIPYVLTGSGAVQVGHSAGAHTIFEFAQEVIQDAA
jgi:hypothetical protein